MFGPDAASAASSGVSIQLGHDVGSYLTPSLALPHTILDWIVETFLENLITYGANSRLNESLGEGPVIQQYANQLRLTTGTFHPPGMD